VAADVAERVERAVLPADHEHGLGAHLHGEEAAGRGEVGDVAGELPRAREDRLLLARGGVGIDIEPRVEGGGTGRVEGGHGMS
jgi:hypothetical protein